jgi:hypothetical protein
VANSTERPKYGRFPKKVQLGLPKTQGIYEYGGYSVIFSFIEHILLFLVFSRKVGDGGSRREKAALFWTLVHT